MNRIARYTIATLLLVVGAIDLAAQSRGTISGRVVDNLGEGIPGATIQVENTSRGTAADVDGRYRIPGVPVGTYTVTITSIGYATEIRENISVAPGETVTVDVRMNEDLDDREARTVVVTGKAAQNTSRGALDARKAALQVTEVSSAEEIQASGASDAGDAVERQTGVTTVGGKAIVRGIPARYSSAQVNGAPMPSPEPETKTLPLDLFPAGMIENITTVKTFTPDNPGDFAGGLVKIDTRHFPSRFLFNVGIGTGFNTATQGADGLTYAGGSSDWLGIDDGSRELPAEAAEIRALTTNQEEAELLESFGTRAWRPESASLPLDGSFSLTLGNRMGSEENPFGILFSASYSGGYNYREGIDRYAENNVNRNGERNFFYDYVTRRATRSTLWGSLFNLSYGLGEGSTVGFKGMLNHTADDEALLVTGDYNASTVGQVRRTQLRFIERTVASGQLMGEHAFDFPSEGATLDWRISHSIADRNEPDNRQTAYLRTNENEPYQYNGNFGSGNGRFFSDLDDRESSFGADWTIPIFSGEEIETNTRLKVGTLNRMRDRSFSARRFVFGLSGEGEPGDAALAPEVLFTPEAVERGSVDFEERTTTTDAYNADEIVSAGYAMIELPATDNLRVITGARVEYWDLNLTPFNPFIKRPQTDLAVDRSVVDFLPSLNLIYGVGDDMNLRGAFSQTLARPEFRELAPFRFDDYKLSTFGNPTLERTRIQNYDLRWEWFTRPGEVIAVSGFYKNFVNPIETFFLLGGSDLQVEPVNADGARAIGVEIEVRKSLDGLGSVLRNFSFGGNLTLTDSKVHFEEGGSVTTYTGQSISQKPVEALTNIERPMQGQSPYVLNMMTSYDNGTTGTEITLLFNLFGQRLATIGTEGFPDVYEQSRGLLDLTLRQKLPAGLSLSLKAKNLLDADVSYTQEFTGENAEIVEVEQWKNGRSLSIGLSFSLDRLRLANAQNSAIAGETTD